jgi:hypothetical protein
MPDTNEFNHYAFLLNKKKIITNYHQKQNNRKWHTSLTHI